jgi:superfamily II DNA or RNA helicase
METLINSGNRRKILPPPFPPIIKDMVQVIVERKSGLVIQPTATGKSIEAAFTARNCILFHNMKGLYLYNENEGLEQARLKFLEIFAGNSITCGSFFGYGRDEFVHEADMVFASFQSLNSQHGKWYQTFDPKHFGFIIVNEAHHSQADTYKEVIEYFECGKVGMTATEKRMDGKDIRDLFPHIICDIPLEKAIAEKWVSELEYVLFSSGISTQKLKKIFHELLEEGKRISVKQLNENLFIDMLDKEMLREIYAYSFPVDEKPRQTLLFCENIDHAKNLLGLMQEDGVSVEAIHSKQSDVKNRAIMKAFRKNEIQFLLSIDKLNEDIDVPNAEVGVFIRATDSENIFYQQMGRLLRRTKLKKKAFILDFVANVNRIMAVKQMVKNIEDFAGTGGEDIFQRGLMKVSGDGFSFSFSQEMVDLMKVLSAIRSGLYSTWQEASLIIQEMGISTSKEYKRSYFKDPKLPSNPSGTYKDFPNWNIFLGKCNDRGDWRLPSELATEDNMPTIQTISKFVEQFRMEHPEWFKKLWYIQSKKREHYHPDLIIKIRSELTYHEAPEDWATITSLVKKGVSYQTITKIAEKFRVKHPEWFKTYQTTTLKAQYYHPTLVSEINKELDKRGELAPTDWLTAHVLSKDIHLGCKSLKILVEKYRGQNPEWFRSFNSKGSGSVEYYHPELVILIRKENTREKAPEDWKSISMLRSLGINNAIKTIEKFTDFFRQAHPEWFQSFPKLNVMIESNEMVEYYHPDLVQKIKEKFVKKDRE